MLGVVLRKKHVVLGISLFVLLIAAMLISYFVAYNVVSDAVYKLGSSYSGSINPETTGASFSCEVVYENTAIIPLTIDHVNLVIFIYNSSVPYDGHLYFMGPPSIPQAIDIGNVVNENKIVPANGQAAISAQFDINSIDALDLIHSGNYSVGATYQELTVSGTVLFWHFTPQIAFQ